MSGEIINKQQLNASYRPKRHFSQSPNPLIGRNFDLRSSIVSSCIAWKKLCTQYEPSPFLEVPKNRGKNGPSSCDIYSSLGSAGPKLGRGAAAVAGAELSH